MAKEILVNQLFAGKYLSEGDNIGHEVINLFEDDMGDHYLYVTPSGMVKWHDVESVIFVRNVHARKTVEVIALGLGLSPVESGAAPDIQYGGVPLSQIFRGNTYHGKEDIFSGNVTYLAQEVLVPANNRIFISVEPEFDLGLFPKSVLLNSSKKVVVPQSLRSYYSSANEPEAYRQLEEMISDKSLWKPVGTAGKLVTDGLSGGRRPTFLEIIGKEDDELALD